MNRFQPSKLTAARLALTFATLAAAQDGRVVVAPVRAISAQERQALEETVRALVAPNGLESLSKPAESSSDAGGALVVPVQSSRNRADGVSVIVLAAQQGNASPSNVGVWHGSPEQSGFAALLSGDVGKLVLRMNDPDASADAQPFGFRRVRLFNDGHEKEYRLVDGSWMLTEFDGAEK